MFKIKLIKIFLLKSHLKCINELNFIKIRINTCSMNYSEI